MSTNLHDIWRMSVEMIKAAAGNGPLRGAAAYGAILRHPSLRHPSSFPYYRFVNAIPRSYVKGNSPILIDELISPLRYDIIIRYDFFTFLRNNMDVYNHQFDKFLSEVKRTEYFVWFQERRFFRYLTNNPNELNRAFELRVRKSACLYLAFEKDGFDSRFPITLHRGLKILPSTSGIRLNGPIFAGDGCHRIALLRLVGQKFLSQDQYRIHKPFFFIPADNTDILVKRLSMSKARYLDFLSLWVGQRQGLDEESLLRCAEQFDRRKRDALVQLVQRYSAI